MIPLRRLLGTGVAAVLLASACNDEAPEPAAEEAAGVSVLLVGDSIMRELADPLTAAVEDAGVDRASFALGPSLPHSVTDLVAWRQFLEREPDVVVFHIGIWERLKVLGDFATGTRVEAGTYRSEVIDPALDMIQDAGATLLWVSPIKVRDREHADFVDALATVWQRAVEQRRGTTYVDVGPVIAPDGFAATLPGPQGLQTVRRADGIHLCPDGQLRVALAITRQLDPQLTVPPTAGWAAAWERTTRLPADCR